MTIFAIQKRTKVKPLKTEPERFSGSNLNLSIMFQFNRKKDKPSKKMFLLDVIPGGLTNEENLSRGEYPEEVFYFENAEKMLEAINDNLSTDWLSEYHPLCEEELEELTVENIMENHEHACGTKLTLVKNEKYSEDNWLLAQVFESCPKVVELTITVIDVFY